jgi:hypothetical protein
MARFVLQREALSPAAPTKQYYPNPVKAASESWEACNKSIDD